MHANCSCEDILVNGVPLHETDFAVDPHRCHNCWQTWSNCTCWPELTERDILVILLESDIWDK